MAERLLKRRKTTINQSIKYWKKKSRVVIQSKVTDVRFLEMRVESIFSKELGGRKNGRLALKRAAYWDAAISASQSSGCHWDAAISASQSSGSHWDAVISASQSSGSHGTGGSGGPNWHNSYQSSQSMGAGAGAGAGSGGGGSCGLVAFFFFFRLLGHINPGAGWSKGRNWLTPCPTYTIRPGTRSSSSQFSPPLGRSSSLR
jgi:hypothetical protein